MCVCSNVASPDRPLPENIEYFQGSILDHGELFAALSGVDRLYHAAAIPDLWVVDKRRFYEVNTLGTCTVLNVARAGDLDRIFYTSTESIIRGVGRGDACERANENHVATEKDMPGAYCRSKYLVDRAALAAADEGLPVVIVNPTMPIGPGDVRVTPPTRMLLGYLNGRFPA